MARLCIEHGAGHSRHKVRKNLRLEENGRGMVEKRQPENENPSNDRDFRKSPVISAAEVRVLPEPSGKSPE